MAERRPRPPVSPATRRAHRLLAGGLFGGHMAAIVSVSAFWIAAGRDAGVSALLAAVGTLLFYTVGLAIQVATADAAPRTVFVASMVSYFGRVGLFGGVLALAMANADAVVWLDSTAVVVTTIAVVIGWLTVEVWVHSRLRIPVFDTDVEEPRHS